MLTMLALLVSIGQALGALDLSALVVSKPASIVEMDLGRLKGEPFRLAWSSERQLYLQTLERDTRGAVTTIRHYLLTTDGQPPKGVDAEPAWAAEYWSVKSAQAAPGAPSHKIAVEQRQEVRRSTAAPMGGAMARGGVEGSEGRGGGGIGVGDAGAAAAQSQTVQIYTLRLKGETVGEWINAAVVPGLTFGWDPSGTGLIAFVNQSGKVVLMDQNGRKHTVQSDKALLPGWSRDGARLAWLERSGRKKITLWIAAVSKG